MLNQIAASNTKKLTLSNDDSLFIMRLKGISMLIVVLGHLGLGWIWSPYSNYVNLVVPLFFFCSGYIFIYLYNKAKNDTSFITARVWGAVFPFYWIFFFAIIIKSIVAKEHISFDFDYLLRILAIAPSRTEMPYPLFQIWFLRVLLFAIISSTIILGLTKKITSPIVFLIPIILGSILTAAHDYNPIQKSFQFFGHNFYQEIVYSLYFYQGLLFAQLRWREHSLKLITCAFILLLIGISRNYNINGSFNITDNAYAPNIFYLFTGFSFIIFVLTLSRLITISLNKLKIVDALIIYSGNHSYSIFLIHTFFILFTEEYFGWLNVIENPLIAVCKVTFVLFASLLAAYPISKITKYFTQLIFKKKLPHFPINR